MRRILVTWVAMVLLWGATASGPAGAAGPESPTGEPDRLRFDAEVIRITVRADTLEVDGYYRLLCPRAPRPGVSLFYPYPADSLLGDARMLAVEVRVGESGWQAGEFREIGADRSVAVTGSSFLLPACAGDTMDVHAIYRQALLGDYARYIVTTTRAWGRPLSSARFEIRLPEGARPVSFSFPFEPVEIEGEVVYVYEAVDFLPDRDVIVEWGPQRE